MAVALLLLELLEHHSSFRLQYRLFDYDNLFKIAVCKITFGSIIQLTPDN